MVFWFLHSEENNEAQLHHKFGISRSNVITGGSTFKSMGKLLGSVLGNTNAFAEGAKRAGTWGPGRVVRDLTILSSFVSIFVGRCSQDGFLFALSMCVYHLYPHIYIQCYLLSALI